MNSPTERLVLRFTKCAAHAGGVETLEAYNFRKRYTRNKEFWKASAKITNADLERLHPEIVAAKRAANEMGTSL